MENEKVNFKDALMPGLIISLVSIAVSLIFQFTIEDLETRQSIGYISYAIVIGLAIYFGIQYRNQRGELGLTYGKSFVYILYMMIVNVIITTVYIYINFTFIDPSMVDQIIQAASDKLYDQGNLTDEQIEQALSMQAKFMTPGWIAFWSIFGSAFFAVVISLVSALFIQKKPVIVIEEN